MSLIIEALKRARDDAVRRQAAARGLPLATVPRLRGRRSWLALVIVPLAAALVICMLLLVDLYKRLPGQASRTNSVIVPPTAGDPHRVPVTASDSVGTSDVGAESGPTTESAATAAQSVPLDEVDERIDDPVTTALAETTDMNPTSSTTAPPRAVVDLGDNGERIFVGQAVLDSGQIIDLGGIAWSESEPYALLNGQVVGVGELIRAYRVTEIHRGEVILEQNGNRVVLRLE